MTTVVLPTEERPIRMDPELAERVEARIKQERGEKRDRARAAVMRVYQSSVSGSFAEIVETYITAIEEAVA